MLSNICLKFNNPTSYTDVYCNLVCFVYYTISDKFKLEISKINRLLHAPVSYIAI